jgi:hypothetical protein
MLLVAGGAVIGVLAFGAHAGPPSARAVDTNPVRVLAREEFYWEAGEQE